MTTQQIVDFMEGSVGRCNDKGFTLNGREGWLNVSRYADPAPALPAEGARVRVGVDKAGYVRSVEVLAEPPASVQEQASAYGAGPDRDTRIMRQAVLNTATAILSSGGQTASAEDVIALAEQLEAWVSR